MDLTHPLLQDNEPAPFPASFPQLRRLDRAVLCPICKELFKAPVSIGCGHSFCSACIRSFLDVSKEKKCPSCHEPAKEGAIRRNRALEEMTDAWEAARPSLLEMAQPQPSRKRAVVGGESGGSSPSKRRKVDEEDEFEIIGDSNSNEEELSENDEAPCPICNATMPISAIPNHIDRGCPPPKAKAGPSGSGNQKADWKKVFAGASSSGGKGKVAEMKRIVKPNYSLIGLSDLRGLLSEHGLPTSGDRAVLEARYQEWTVLYNANLDTSHPSSLPALRAQLANAEAARKRDKEKGKDADVEALKTKEGMRQHVKEQQSEFQRLRQEILDRRNKKHGTAVDTAIEVE